MSTGVGVASLASSLPPQLHSIADRLLAMTAIGGAPWLTLCIRLGAMTTAYVGLMYALGRLRLLPRRVAQLYWVSLAPVAIIAMRLGTETMNLAGRLLGMSEDRRTGLANWAFCTTQVVWASLCGHIRVTMDAESKRVWDEMPRDRATIVLTNHNSFMDALMLAWSAPHWFRACVRVMFMGKMLSWPIFGGCLPLCGHFPVHFSKYTEGSFKVSEKQAKVTEDIDAYLSRGGRIMLFPEATLAKQPWSLLPFRTGTFKLMHKHKVQVYLLTMDGTYTTWHRSAPLGGMPADMTLRMRRFELRYDEGESPEAMALRAQAEMTAQLFAQAPKLKEAAAKAEVPAPGVKPGALKAE